jgi:tetratricopeptide (TPR) repeat protein
MKLTQLIMVIGVGLLLAVGNLSAQEQDVYKGLRHLKLGNKYYKQGKFKQAAKEYKIAWEEGRLLDAGYNLSHLYDLKLNNNELAIQYYTEYIKEDPFASDITEIEQLLEKAKRDLSKEKEWRERLAQENTPIQTGFQKIPDPADSPPPDKEGFNNGVARACLSCHVGFMGASIDVEATHPVGRVPKGDLAETVPFNVRFYKEGQVNCLSCHNPENIHFEQGTPGKTYKVLRVDTGPEGEDMSRFCAMCHKAQSSAGSLRESEDEMDSLRRPD